MFLRWFWEYITVYPVFGHNQPCGIMRLLLKFQPCPVESVFRRLCFPALRIVQRFWDPEELSRKTAPMRTRCCLIARTAVCTTCLVAEYDLRQKRGNNTLGCKSSQILRHDWKHVLFMIPSHGAGAGKNKVEKNNCIDGPFTIVYNCWFCNEFCCI